MSTHGEGYKDQITDLVTKAFEEAEILVTPIYPRVVVRVLPRAGKSGGGIWMPQKHNKILLEGVVLATYKPLWRHFRTVKENGEDHNEDVLIEPSVAVGDHVLFVHYEGQPITPLTDDYRVINEDVIHTTLDYQDRQVSMTDLRKTGTIGVGYMSEDAAVAVLAKFHVIRKDLHSMTLSGV